MHTSYFNVNQKSLIDLLGYALDYDTRIYDIVIIKHAQSRDHLHYYGMLKSREYYGMSKRSKLIMNQYTVCTTGDHCRYNNNRILSIVLSNKDCYYIVLLMYVIIDSIVSNRYKIDYYFRIIQAR